MPDPPLPVETMEVKSLADAVTGEAIVGGGGDKNSDPSSPEFEFWMDGNPSLPQPDLPSADQLFTNGVILPLHLLRRPRSPPEQTSSAVPSSTSKRWGDIFKAPNREKKPVEKETRKNPKNSPGGAAELNININIWPFSRSRSAGTGSSRSKGVSTANMAARRVSSAPCSRSNSRGESCRPAPAARRWASSPGRPSVGVHVGRASPVWQARKTTRKAPPISSAVIKTGGAAKNRGLKISSQLSECGTENRRCPESGGEFVVPSGGGNIGHFSTLKAFFSKVF